jgi:hypothetical protein
MRLLYITILTIFLAQFAHAYQTQHVVVILIDGVRYTESPGDSTHTYAPRMRALPLITRITVSCGNSSLG